MKFELKTFQEEKRRELQNKLNAARLEFSRSGELQAIVLSSPTGSGKTITIGALLESLFEGDDEYLHAGVVYFINTQLLGKDKLLTQEGGDRRTFTFWRTIANTVRDYGNDLLLIIDEAHRGM